MSSNDINHQNNPTQPDNMRREDDGNRPSENNAPGNNAVPPRPAHSGAVRRGYDVGNRDNDRRMRTAAHIRRLDPFIGGRYPDGSNFRPGIQRNAHNHNRVFSNQTQSDHRSIIRSWLRQIFFNLSLTRNVD